MYHLNKPSRRRGAPYILVVLALVAAAALRVSPADALLGMGPVFRPKPPPSLGAPTNFTATATSPSTLALQWTPAPPDARVRHAVVSYDYGRAIWSARWTCASCSTLILDGLTAGGAYALQLYSMDAGNNRSTASWLSATLPANGCGAGAGFCLTVDTATAQPALSHAASGFMKSTTAPTAHVAPLKPRAWRVSARDAAAVSTARAAGATVTALLSDAYLVGNTRNGTRVIRNPWDDWNRYRAFVSDTVRWHIDNGVVPDWWEIQNEANPSYYSTLSPPNRQRVLEQFRVAHDAIRSVLPHALIAAPSLAGTVWASQALIDLPSFLEYAAAQRLRFDVISWHPIGAADYSDPLNQPEVIVDDAAMIRQLVRERPSLGTTLVAANEYGSAFWRGNPGATVRYFDALERAGVDGANLACYPVSDDNWMTRVSSCDQGLLSGLRTTSGSTAANYWTYATYAGMEGARVPAHSDNSWVSAIATRTSSTDLAVLIGRAHNCTPGVQDFCPSGVEPDPASPGAIVVNGLVDGTYNVTVQQIPNAPGALPGPVGVSTEAINSAAGILRVSLGSVADGDAIILRLTRR